jgi:hypothetical protein
MAAGKAGSLFDRFAARLKACPDTRLYTDTKLSSTLIQISTPRRHRSVVMSVTVFKLFSAFVQTGNRRPAYGYGSVLRAGLAVAGL